MKQLKAFETDKIENSSKNKRMAACERAQCPADEQEADIGKLLSNTKNNLYYLKAQSSNRRIYDNRSTKREAKTKNDSLRSSLGSNIIV
mgnify:CR=1 FL=1